MNKKTVVKVYSLYNSFFCFYHLLFNGDIGGIHL